MTKVEEYKEALEDAEVRFQAADELKTAAIRELLASIQSSIAELNKFGFEYALGDHTPTKRKGRPAGSKNKKTEGAVA